MKLTKNLPEMYNHIALKYTWLHYNLSLFELTLIGLPTILSFIFFIRYVLHPIWSIFKKTYKIYKTSLHLYILLL